ncbi:PQQ-binding-like beta-propeller repeat protein [Vulgatibacter sp.]|uniref:outer membrane protein assembly factor BamB family protein n=1 Tax=Vulgatibacter sp. TaxID=1971226 RepID=UPI003569DFA6
MIRLYTALVCTALLLGCSSDSATVDASGELVVRQSVLEFPRTFVGYDSTVDLVVENTGFTKIPITLSITGHFSMRRGREVIDRGEVRRLWVRFNPAFAGPQTGVLTMEIGGETRQVLLSGTAENPPPCNPSAACRAVEFDPVSGTCTESVLPDDAPCTSGNLCQVDERCLDGLCVGEAKFCGDGNVCTADACDPARGCVHVDQTAGCPQPANPCEVPICDPDDGCGVADAVEGTLCGPADCKLAFVCLGGECEEIGEDLLEGTTCIDECGEGTCEAGECERPDNDRLEQLWSYQPPQGSELLFPGINDGAGQLYWIERDAAAVTHLVSATSGGIIRYRAPAAGGAPVSERGLVLEDAMALVAGADEAQVTGHLTRDGSSPWRRDLQPSIDELFTCPCTVADGSLTRSESGRAFYAANVSAVGESPAGFVAMLRTGSGEVAWTQQLEGPIGTPIADEAGNLYVLVEQGAGAAVLLSLAPDGSERWRIDTALDATPLLAWDGVVLQAIDRLLSAEDGDPVGRLQFTAAHGASPLAGSAGSWAFTTTAEGNLIARAFNPERVGTATTGLFVTPLGTPPLWSEPILTRRDSALLSTSTRGDDGTWTPLLREILPDGDEKRTCELGISGTVTGATSLRAGKWVVRTDEEGVAKLRAYELPLADPASTGWVHPLGSPAGGGRPQ